jgi:hypothetical protein
MRKSLETYRFIGLAVCAMLLLAACSRKVSPERKPLKNRSASNVLNRYDDQRFRFEQLSMRISADVVTPQQSQGFKANLRIAHDSLIWMSVSPLMGVEMVRVLMTKDSVSYVSKVPGDKHYFKGTYLELANMTQSELDYSMIENLLVGNLVQLNEEEDRFASRIDERAYVLLSRYNRRLKRVVGGTDLKELEPDDSLEVDINERRYQRIVRRSDEEELLMKRYWVSGDHYRPVKTVFDDLYYKRFLQIDHSAYEELDGMLYPAKTVLTAGAPEGTATFSIEINRIKRASGLDFPFEIPDDYVRKTLP